MMQNPQSLSENFTLWYLNSVGKELNWIDGCQIKIIRGNTQTLFQTCNSFFGKICLSYGRFVLEASIWSRKRRFISRFKNCCINIWKYHSMFHPLNEVIRGGNTKCEVRILAEKENSAFDRKCTFRVAARPQCVCSVTRHHSYGRNLIWVESRPDGTIVLCFGTFPLNSCNFLPVLR